MFTRDLFLNQIRDFIDKPFIKVITGIRRNGKSLCSLHHSRSISIIGAGYWGVFIPRFRMLHRGLFTFNIFGVGASHSKLLHNRSGVDLEVIPISQTDY